MFNDKVFYLFFIVMGKRKSKQMHHYNNYCLSAPSFPIHIRPCHQQKGFLRKKHKLTISDAAQTNTDRIMMKRSKQKKCSISAAEMEMTRERSTPQHGHCWWIMGLLSEMAARHRVSLQGHHVLL